MELQTLGHKRVAKVVLFLVRSLLLAFYLKDYELFVSL